MRAALALHAERRTEIQEKQDQLPDLSKLSRIEARTFRPPKSTNSQAAQYGKELLEKTSGQGWVTVAKRDTALSTFETLKTKATGLQQKADDAQAKEMADGLTELVTLMQEVDKLGEDIAPAEHDGFRKHHEARRRQRAAAASRIPLPR